MTTSNREFHNLFRSETNGYLGALNVTKKDKEDLKDARQNVREALEKAFKDYGKRQRAAITPRFMSQGSAVYKTQNHPNFLPPQQVDHDFGCYLPFSYLDARGTPGIAAAEFFTVVDTALTMLAKERHYQKVVTSKNTCSRLVVNDRLHIDVPLYSVPDKEMETIIANAQAKSGLDIVGEQELTDAYYDLSEGAPSLPSDRVMLAHRKEGWKNSDPRKLNIYFKRILTADQQLLRICRYLKGFRDQQWRIGGPSSIALMIIAAEAKNLIPADTESDSDAFLKVIQALPELLASPIRNPTDPGEVIAIAEDDKKNLIHRSIEFAQAFHKAIHDLSISDQDACGLIQKHLGRRFPITELVARKIFGRTDILKKPADIVLRQPPSSHRSG